MGFSKELVENQNVVLEFERGEYNCGVLTANSIVSGKFKSICYITMSKSATAVEEFLKKSGVDSKKYRFIDCVSKKTGFKKNTKKTVFISSPSSLTEIGIAVSKSFKEKKIDLLFFDSISSLLVYNNELDSVKFLHSLMVLVKGTKAKAVYLIMKSDLSKKVVRDIEIFSDSITWLE